MSNANARCYAAIVSSWITCMSVGFVMAYPTTALPDIASGNYGSMFPSGRAEAWYISCTPISSVVGSLVAFPTCHKYGRRMPLMVMIALTAVGWMITASAIEITMMFVGRILLSIADQANQGILFMFMAELMPSKIRGMASFGLATSYLTGIALSYVLGTFVSWRWLAVISIGLELVSIVSVWLFLPETPRWLIMNGNREFAKDNLSKLRHYANNFDEKIEEELHEMEQSFGISESKTVWETIRMFIYPPLLRPFVIICVLTIFQQMTGTAYIKSYTVKIFDMSSGTNDVFTNVFLANPHYQTITVGFSGVLGSLLSIPASEYFGRRHCLITSGLVTTLSLSAVAIYFWLHNFFHQWTVITIGWLPLMGLMCFNVGYGIGYSAVLGTLSNEFLPTCARPAMIPIIGFLHSLGYFFVVQFFGGLNVAPHIMFTTYACVGVIGVLFIATFIPETKNKSLEEIEKIWSKTSFGPQSTYVEIVNVVN